MLMCKKVLLEQETPKDMLYGLTATPLKQLLSYEAHFALHTNP